MIEKSIDCMGEDISSVISAWTVAQVQYLLNRLQRILLHRLNVLDLIRILHATKIWKQKLPHNHDRFRSLKWTEKDKNGLKMVLNGIITMNYVTSHFDCSQTDVFKRRNSTNEDFHRIYAIFDQNRTISRWKWPISHRNQFFCPFFDKFINS